MYLKLLRVYCCLLIYLLATIYLCFPFLLKSPLFSSHWNPTHRLRLICVPTSSISSRCLMIEEVSITLRAFERNLRSCNKHCHIAAKEIGTQRRAVTCSEAGRKSHSGWWAELGLPLRSGGNPSHAPSATNGHSPPEPPWASEVWALPLAWEGMVIGPVRLCPESFAGNVFSFSVVLKMGGGKTEAAGVISVTISREHTGERSQCKERQAEALEPMSGATPWCW